MLFVLGHPVEFVKEDEMLQNLVKLIRFEIKN